MKFRLLDKPVCLRAFERPKTTNHPVQLFTYAYISGYTLIFCCLSHTGRPNDILTFSDQGFQINGQHYGDEKTGSCTCTRIQFLCTCRLANTNEEPRNKILTSPLLFYVTIIHPFSPTRDSLCAKSGPLQLQTSTHARSSGDSCCPRPLHTPQIRPARRPLNSLPLRHLGLLISNSKLHKQVAKGISNSRRSIQQ